MATTSGADSTTSCSAGFLQKSRACLEYVSKVSFLVKYSRSNLFSSAELIPGTGLYTAIFIMYLQYQTSKRSVIDIVQNVLFYLICILYVLSVVTIIGDTVDFIITVSSSRLCRLVVFYYYLHSLVQYLDTARPPSNSLLLHLAFLQVTVTGCCDFLAQLILVSMANPPLSCVLFI